MTKDTVTVRVNLEVSGGALQAMVETAKRVKGKDAQGRFRVDTADLLEKLISKFLAEKEFEAYVKEAANYPSF